ncbi:MAG: hypothetical protein IT209_00780 [Armatimonadetes bacterium]|nr:hypothetical protein [Armatimonadota bacterium]
MKRKNGHLLKFADGRLMRECCCGGSSEPPPRPVRPEIISPVIDDHSDLLTGGASFEANVFEYYLDSWATPDGYTPVTDLPCWCGQGGWTWRWGPYLGANIAWRIRWDALPDPYNPGDDPNNAHFRLEADVFLQCGASTLSETITVYEGAMRLELYAPTFGYYFYVPQVHFTVDVSAAFPLRHRLDYAEYDTWDQTHLLDGQDISSDPANYTPKKWATGSWEFWPEDIPLFGQQCYIRVDMQASNEDGQGAQNRTVHGSVGVVQVGGAGEPTPPQFTGPAQADMAQIVLYTEVAGNAGEAARVRDMSSYSALPNLRPAMFEKGTYVAGEEPTLIGMPSPVTPEDLYWFKVQTLPNQIICFFEGTQKIDPDVRDPLHISLSYAPRYDMPLGIYARKADGELTERSLKVAEHTFTGSTVIAHQKDCYAYSVQSKWGDTGNVGVADVQQIGPYHFDRPALEAAHYQPGAWRVPLRIPLAMAVWDAIGVRTQSGVVFDDGSGDWTPSGCSVSFSGGKLRVVVSAPGQSISRTVAASKCCLSSARLMRFKASCSIAPAAAYVKWTPAKQWGFTLGSTVETPVTLDLCAPDNLSGADDAMQSRFYAEWMQTQGGWGWGVDNGRDRSYSPDGIHFLDSEGGNHKAAFQPTVTITFSTVGTWTFDDFGLVDSDFNKTGVVGVADMIADDPEWQSGQLQTQLGDVDLFVRLGVFAVRGRTVMQEAMGWGWDDPLAGRKAEAQWLGGMVYQNRRRMGPLRSLVWLESLRRWEDNPWQSGQFLGRLLSGEPDPSSERYTLPMQFFNDAQDCTALQFALRSYGDTALEAHLWADQLICRPGFTADAPGVYSLVCQRWFGGLTYGVMAQAGMGPAGGASVGANSADDSQSTSTHADGYYQTPGLHKESYTVAGGGSSQTHAVESWTRINLEKT